MVTFVTNINHQNRKRIKQSLDIINILNSFVKLNITIMNEEEFINFYKKFTLELESKGCSIKKIIKQDIHKFNNVKQLLITSQSFLLYRMKEISHIIVKFKNTGLMEIINLDINISVCYDSHTRKFVNRSNITNVFTVQIESEYLNNLYHLIINFSFKRFKVCKKCNLPFFQATKREKIYCSDKCSNAERQKRFKKNKNNKRRGNLNE